ncbi:hypothetical protein MalM25_13150 [Planctomycetes bacterium MalM25]|nr:hypothetical protein MalM25_13150 [Planctomycetes bacterium MalM25]
MRILNATIDSQGEVPLQRARLTLGAVSPGLAAYQSDSIDASGVLAGLLSELLLGQSDARWSASRWAAGETRLGTRYGELQLRRGGSPRASKLTLVPQGPRPADAPPAGPNDWQSGLPTSVLSAVFFAEPTPLDPLRPLLSAPVAEAFTRLSSRRQIGQTLPEKPSTRPAEQLLRRRDELAGRIEALLAARRQESVQLDERLVGLDADREALASHVEELRRRVRALAEQLDADGARVRYEELTRVAAEAEGRQAADEWGPRVEELDEEVARWRATLAELESRETYVRAELARVRPDDAAPQLLLADQRASVAVTQRLVADLESEVARFARSGDSPHCVCNDAHPRMNPLVETLGRHVERLADLIRQQDDALRTQELLSEAAQLERSQSELRRQLEHLLERRQTLWRSSRARNERTDQAPVESLDRAAVEHDHRTLGEELSAQEAKLQALDRERHDLSERRRRLLDAGQLGDWQRELDELQAELARAVDRPVLITGGSLRASDVLARLTDGEFVELRLVPGGRTVEARDRTGRIVPQHDLPTAVQRLVAWSLRLALADACHAAEAPFALICDQPFLDLDDRLAANLATCLDDYARRGRQIVLLARDGAGLNRLRSLGVIIHKLDGETAADTPVEPITETVVHEEAVARPWLLDIDDPIARFPAPFAERDTAFRRARIRTVGELIGGDPSALAEEMAVEGVTAELVSLWQAHTALVCFTAGLDLQAAKLLVECDVLFVEQLAAADPEHLRRALRKRGASAEQQARVEQWIEAASSGVERWKSTGYAKAWRRNRRERRDRIRENASRRRSRSDERPRKRRVREKKKVESSLKFYLEPSDDVEAAPSIGPKRAAQLTALGVARVSQLLEADPQDLAARLEDKRVDSATIVAWQHQAGLMCRVPGLRGHDAQVLVGSGFTQPEEIAAIKPAELLEFVEPFCDTSEGQRALRGSARPDLAEVTQWVEGARQRRAVEVA